MVAIASTIAAVFIKIVIDEIGLSSARIGRGSLSFVVSLFCGGLSRLRNAAPARRAKHVVRSLSILQLLILLAQKGRPNAFALDLLAWLSLLFMISVNRVNKQTLCKKKYL